MEAMADVDDFRQVLLSFLSEVDVDLQTPLGPIHTITTPAPGVQLQQQQQQQHQQQHHQSTVISGVAGLELLAETWSNGSGSQGAADASTSCSAQQQQQAPSAQQQQASATQERPAHPKRIRKRGPSTQQRVAELEKRLAEQTAVLERLSLDNAFMAERVRMLELVIKVRNDQLERMRLIGAGLWPNPWSNAAEMEEVKNATPAMVVSGFVKVCDKFAMRLAPLLPVLEQHPELLFGPAPGTPWVLVTEGPGGAVELPKNDTVDAKVLQDLYQVVREVDKMQAMSKTALFIAPHLMLASSLHLHAVDPEQHGSWQALSALIKDEPQATSVGLTGTSATSSSSAASGSGQQASAVAPESHWKMVVAHMRLSEQQRLQAAVLRTIITRPLADIRRQRAQLGAAFAGLHAAEEQGTAGDQALLGPSGEALGSLTSTGSGGDGGGGGGGGGPPGEGMAPGVSHSRPFHHQDSGERALQRQETSGSGKAGSSSTTRGPPQVSWRSLETELQEPVLLKRLQLSILKEMCLVKLVTEVLCYHVLTPMQTALIMVNTWPYFPDDLAMLNATADEYKVPPPASL